VFGPVPRDYSYDFPRMARRRALASALSEKARKGQLLVVDALPLETVKTRAVAEYVRAGLKLEGKVLIVFDGDNRTLEMASRNHPQIGALRALSLHAYDVLNHDAVVISRAAAEQLGEVLSR
jgi:large subunit ribosomal protein L4